MGNQISTLDSSHTDGVTVKDKHTFTVTKSGTKPQVLMTDAIALAHQLTIAVSLRADFSQSSPFVAISLTKKLAEELKIPDDPNLILWSLKDQKIYWKGKVYTKTQIVCTSGCEVEVSWSMKWTNIKLWVKSIDGNVQTDEIPVERLECDKLWLLFGVISVGSKKPVAFELLNKSVEPSELTDVTDSVRFCSAGGKISISSDGMRISRISKDSGNGVALIDRVIKSGTHSWKLEVVSDFGASVCLGLAVQSFQMSDKYRGDPLKHIYHHRGLYLWKSDRGFLYQLGCQLPHSLEPLGWQNDCPVVVEFTLNMNEGTLEIFKNGKSLGVAFRDIRGPVQPAAAFYAAYEKDVRLISFQSSEVIISKGIVERDSVSKVPHSSRVTFDPRPTSSKGVIVLSDDNMSLCRKREHSGNAYCLLSLSLLSGCHRWSFVVQNDQGASTCIGVAREPVRLNKTGNLYTSPDLYVFRSFQGMLYSEGKELKKRCREFWLSGSLVEVSFEVLPSGGVVRYSVNGEDQGVAFSNIALPVRPIVGFYAGMEKKITLVHYEHTPQEFSPSYKLKDPMNDVNTDRTNDSREHDALPMFIRPTEVAIYYDACVVCGAKVDTIALPCKHSTLCANHLVLDGSQKCLVCEKPITGVCNILKLL